MYGKRETEAIIRLIFHHLKGWSPTDMIIHEGDSLSEFSKKEIDGILDRLKNYEPIQYITGEARFHGMDFMVSKDVLVPRPETDELVDIIVKEATGKKEMDVLDIGTGSGAIAISLSKSLNFPNVMATDVSEKALSIAKENAKRHKVKVKFEEEDILKVVPQGKFDIIVSNPPYIKESEMKEMEENVKNHEPHLALFVPDNDPLKYYKRIIELLPEILKNGGRIYFEINPDHGEELKALMKKSGLKETEIIKDSYGKDRFIRSISSAFA